MPKTSRMVMRGLVRHCPRCGAGHLFPSWFKLAERCPGCGLKFEREPGFWLGGYVINFATGEVAILVLLAVLIGFEANHRPVNAVVFASVGVVLSIVGPILTFPFSRTLWSAVDLAMRPLAPEEIVEAQAAVAQAAIEPLAVKPKRRRRDRAGR
jgi:uncharacterized protein (DUF983 family)